MTLNMDKTVIMNIISLANISLYTKDVTINNLRLTLATTKFLGLMVDSRLNFDTHVQYITSKCNSRIYLMRQLKSAGMKTKGLKVIIFIPVDKTFYSIFLMQLANYHFIFCIILSVIMAGFSQS